MQTALFPEVTFPKITLIADNGQQPIDRMMITVTKPLESAVKRVKGVTTVKSSTSRGSCVIEVYFNWDIDIYFAKTQIESRINEIKGMLPSGVIISTEAMNQSLFPVYGYTLESKTKGLIALKDNANLLVRPLFSQVPGISNVVVRGGKVKEYVIIPDPVKMSSLGITPNSLKTVFNNTNFVESNGNLADYHRLYLTLTETRVNDIEALKDIIIKNDGNRIITLKDIASVDLQEQKEFVIVNANGNDAVLIDLVKQQGINLIDFAGNVKAKAEEVRKALPPGIELKTYYDQSAFVGDSIDSVIKTIYEGLILAIFVMIIFLRSWRASLVVLLTIPVTIAFSITLLYVNGLTINIMSLGGIAAAIGLIIDDAIVIIEQIYRTHEEHPEKDNFTIVKEAIRDLFPAMIGSSLSTIVIFIPFRLMSGLAGSFFKELSATMQIVLVCSFLATWFVLPVLHLALGFRHTKKIQQHSFNTNQLRWLTWLFDKPVYAIVFVVILAGGAYYVSDKLETGFLPDLDEGTIVLDYYSPSGTSLEETDRMLREVEQILTHHPEVETYSRRTGMGMGFKTRAQNYGDYSIQLKKSRTHKTVDVIDDLRKKIEATQPSLHVSFGQRISDLLGDLMNTPSPIEIKIFGDDQHKLESLAHQAENILNSIKGIADIENGLVLAGPSIVFHPDVQKLAQFNITLTDFQSQLTAYTGGIPLGINANGPVLNPAQLAMAGGLQVGTIQDGEQMRRILMRFTNFSNNSLEKIKSQLIFLPDGTTKPVSFFSDVQIISGETELKREDLKSDIVLTARLNNRDLGSTIKEIQQRFAKDLALPQGYTVAYGGAYSEQQNSFKELLLILIAASLLVFAVLLFLFRHWLISLLILFISVLGISGCILALYFTGIPLNVGSYTGIIMIVGIIAENAIFTVNQFFANLKAGGNVDDSIKYAIALRIRPKLMTALGAILALMPLALGIGLGAQMQQPLAIAVIGGFVAGIPLLLFVFPSFIRLIYFNKINSSNHERPFF
ncbi:acriflavine resistance protein B [Niastella vici]|uniref:Acriflavine resistance protein B n=2 Tax=Niastella vici TaxID=1703345 RepID=A0A1V9FPD4_9BACT|nr:acriflavine resistance protein B [Niastella vici]